MRIIVIPIVAAFLATYLGGFLPHGLPTWLEVVLTAPPAEIAITLIGALGVTVLTWVGVEVEAADEMQAAIGFGTLAFIAYVVVPVSILVLLYFSTRYAVQHGFALIQGICVVASYAAFVIARFRAMKKYHSEEPDPEDEPLGWDLPGGLSRMAQGYALASFMFMSIYADLSMPLFFGVVLYEHGWPAWIVTCTVIALWIVFIIIDWMIGNFAAERLARTER